ncbi:unnamed protein product [Pieris macdunnoughi]|uniref:Carboxylic ester hydrolase n=1 Tax=Pieris macdunnoughi TaxID=345717 RepID=A0A821USF1_9NEOP|nr:unnamed protein product [Pieris macdunnoughi]
MTMAILDIVFIFSLVNSVYGAQIRVDPLVLIDQGLVSGLKSSDGSYSKFLGIPYGQVDLNNPFGEAYPHPGFGSEVYKAYVGTKLCPQSIKSSATLRAADGAEETLDCLRLNVYAPTVASSQNPLPVLIWIHGGIYAEGSAGNYGPENLVKQGIVVVTINYRLGPYGFMCLDVPSVPGNTGLKDQYLALRWVRNHIRAFGGNPYNVTIGGQSAGAGSILHHLYSKKDKLYSKVIVQSGTPQKPVSFTEADEEAAIKISSHLGFNTTDTVKALEFLTKSSHVLVARAAADLNLKLRPCKEKYFDGVENFIDTNPFSLSNAKKVKNTPILIGQTSKEHYGSQAKNSDEYYKTDPFLDILKDNFIMDDDMISKAAQTVRHFYIGDKGISRDIASELETFTTDFLYNHPIERTLVNLLNEKASPVYEYEFRYLANEDKEGAPHCEELKYLFQYNDVVVEQNDENQLVISRVTKLWANFIKYGNPTPTVDELLPIKWTPVSEGTRPYMIIDSELKIENRVNKERMAFWDLFYEAFGQYNKYLKM